MRQPSARDASPHASFPPAAPPISGSPPPPQADPRHSTSGFNLIFKHDRAIHIFPSKFISTRSPRTPFPFLVFLKGDDRTPWARVNPRPRKQTRPAAATKGRSPAAPARDREAEKAHPASRVAKLRDGVRRASGGLRDKARRAGDELRRVRDAIRAGPAPVKAGRDARLTAAAVVDEVVFLAFMAALASNVISTVRGAAAGQPPGSR